MNTRQPQHFSGHFKVDKSKLKELGVFDPILNFDTKVFVDPLLLKKSSNEIIRNSAKTFDKFFIDVLNLVKISQEEGDRPWRQAQRVVKFPEYKYTCIGYGADSIDGSGGGAWLNDKILHSAKEIVGFAKNDPQIFLILPLLEEGVGADIISDMTQNIIDQEICEFTVDVMQKLGLEGNFRHRAKNGVIYNLLKNPYNRCPIKLLPYDLLLDLPLAENFDGWLLNMTDINSDLRDAVSKHLGQEWFEETKVKKKESLLDLLKTDHAFFVQVLETLKNHDFSHYDIQEDWQGLHRWLNDSEKFIKFEPSSKVGFINDDLKEISLAVREIVDQFKYSIEKDELWRIFWTKGYSKLSHAKEFYSQMLFYMVANSWINSKDTNLYLVRSLNKETKQIDFKFSIRGKYCVDVQVKHADNYNGLKKSYDKKVDQKISRAKEHDYFLVMNFEEEPSKQLKEIQQSEVAGFEVMEIDVSDRENRQEEIFEFAQEGFEFGDMFVEYEKSPNNPYVEGANKRHDATNNIKNNIIKPMFANDNLIKGKTTQQKADKIHKEISEAFAKKDKYDRPYSEDQINAKLSSFAKKYQLDLEILTESADYFEEDKSERIYKWCLKF